MMITKDIASLIEEPISGEWGEEGTGVKIIRTTNFTNHGRLNLTEVVERNVESHKIAKKRLKYGDIILEKSGGGPKQPVGRVVYFDVDNGDTFLCNNFTAIIRPKNEVQPRFLFWFLFFNHASNNTLRFQNKTTGINNLQLSKYLASLKVPFPELESQERIASILDQADALRQKDQQLLKKYDELLESVFYQLFGDPVKNEKGWDTFKFNEVGCLDRGVSKNRPRNAPELLGGSYPLIQTGDVANSNGYIKSFKSSYSEIGLKQSKMWQVGTLCITIAANIAKTGILTFPACFPDSVVGFIPNQKTVVEYIQWWLSHLQETLEKNAPQSAQKNINLEILRNLDVPIPPIELQNRFRDIVVNLERQKEVCRKTIQNSELLFHSLLQKAFKGELMV